MLNAFYNPFFGLDTVCISIAAGHGYCRLNNVAVVCGREKFGDFHFISYLDQSLPFHFKFFFTHKYAFFPYEYAIYLLRLTDFMNQTESAPEASDRLFLSL